MTAPGPEVAREGIDPALLVPGFANLVLDSQATFRAALRALSRPGIPVEVPVALQPPPPLGPALAALALTLLDAETPVWLDAATSTPAVRTFLRFHCGCRLVPDPLEGRFAIVTAPTALPAFEAFHPGCEEYPDRSATVLVQLPSLRTGAPLAIRGPGIDGVVRVAPAGLPADFVEGWGANRAAYPQGVDVFLVADRETVGLPRSVSLERAGPGTEERTACT